MNAIGLYFFFAFWHWNWCWFYVKEYREDYLLCILILILLHFIESLFKNNKVKNQDN